MAMLWCMYIDLPARFENVASLASSSAVSLYVSPVCASTLVMRHFSLLFWMVRAMASQVTHSGFLRMCDIGVSQYLPVIMDLTPHTTACESDTMWMFFPVGLASSAERTATISGFVNEALPVCIWCLNVSPVSWLIHAAPILIWSVWSSDTCLSELSV